VVEVDGYAAHSSPTAFERDRCKDAELAELGIAVRRFSAKRVRDQLDHVVAWTRRALSRT
jgi:very-short-patch-repair endonuclease